MGGKQSTAAPVSAQSANNHGAVGSNQILSTRRNTIDVGSHHRNPYSSQWSFDSSNLMNIDRRQRDVRPLRANSAVESRMRVPRNGFEFFFVDQLQAGINFEEENAGTTRTFTQHSMPYSHHFVSQSRDTRCSMCGKMIPAEDTEVHFVMCATKPRVSYNEDVLTATAGECPICFEDLEKGEVIARLPCLCIYHKICIDQWFMKSQTCPEHPPD